MPRPRNPVARSPLLRKGGAHVKSKTGQRVRSRLSMEDAIDEWYETTESDINDKEQQEGEACDNGGQAPRPLLDFDVHSTILLYNTSLESKLYQQH